VQAPVLALNSGPLPFEHPMNFPMRQILMRISLLALAFFAFSAHAQITTVVISTLDFGPGTLRQAIQDVNANNGGTINFNIDPKISGPGPWTIRLNARLDTILYPTTIDGYSQPGAKESPGPGLDTIMIEVDATNTNFYALSFYFGAIKSRVFGLSLYGSDSNAAQIIALTNSVLFRGNYIGIRADGETAVLGGNGIIVAMSFGAQVRDNLFGPVDKFSLGISGTGHTVDGNWFGLSRYGAPLQTRRTQSAICAGCTIGIAGSDILAAIPIQRIQFGLRNSVITNNVIVNTNAEAILLSGFGNGTEPMPPGTLASFGNTVSKNIVGGDYLGQAANGNIRMAMRITGGTRNNRIVENTFMNADFGIVMKSVSSQNKSAGVANTIRNNNFRVTEVPIGFDGNLPTANDTLDIDTGTNNFQNKPTLTFFGSNGRVRGTFDGAANQKVIIDFYTATLCTPSGFGSGGYPMGNITVTTDANGRAQFDSFATRPLGGFQATHVISATATAIEIDANGAEVETDTSEFSECQRVVVPLATTTKLDPLPGYVLARDQSVQLKATVSNANSTFVTGTIEFSAANASGERVLGRAQLQGNQATLSAPDGVLANSGKYQIIARYLGDDNYKPSEGMGATVVFRPPSALLIDKQSSLVRYRLSGMAYETELNGNWSPSNLGNGNRVLDIAAYLNGRLDRFLTVDPNNRLSVFDITGVSTPVASRGFNQNDRLEDFTNFDLDYRMDALVFSQATNKWQITLCAFDASENSCERTAPLNVSDVYRNALTGDFNGDGTMDILWSDASGRGKAISLMQGTRMLSQQTINAPMNYRAVATGDFDGDGFEDIVWHNPAASDVLVWFMKGGALREEANIMMRGMDIESRGPAYFAGVGAANYGHASLIWRDSSSGEVFAWDDIRPSSGALSYMQRSIFTKPNVDLEPTR
jgi:hypothetical protein